MNKNDFLSLIGTEHWSNTACMGYVIKACKSLNYSREEISIFLGTISAMFSNFTIEQAESEYIEF